MKFTKVEFQSIQNATEFQIDKDTCLTDEKRAMLNKPILTQPLKTVSLFTGCGGSDQGLIDAGLLRF